MEKEFLKIIEAYQGIIHKVVNLYAFHEQERRDLFQEVLLQLWRSYDSYDPNKGNKISTWIYRVAFNTAITSVRKKYKEIETISISSDHFQIHENLSNRSKSYEFLYSAIRELKAIDRSVIYLYLDEKSYKEIGQIIGISESNVGVKLNRIKPRLKEILNRKSNEDSF